MRILAIFLLPLLANAEGDLKVAAAPPPGATPAIVYELRDLKPSGLTQYTGAGDIVRQYFDFQNEQGTHHVIYEEVASALPSRTIPSLRQAANSYDSDCNMDIECTSKAFCTGDCKNMYYETANAPGDVLAPDRNKCRLLFFSCEKAGPPHAAAATPTTPLGK